MAGFCQHESERVESITWHTGSLILFSKLFSRGGGAFWDLNPEWRSRSCRHAMVGRHFGEATVPEGECGPCPVFASLYRDIRLTTEEKSRKNISCSLTFRDVTKESSSVSLKDLLILIDLHLVISQKTGIFISIAVATPDVCRATATVAAYWFLLTQPNDERSMAVRLS